MARPASPIATLTPRMLVGGSPPRKPVCIGDFDIDV